jgi:alcohol dehydrogenase
MAEWERVFSFTLPASIVSGPGSLGRAGELLGGMGVSRPLIVTDPGIAGAGITDKLLEALGGGGFEIFDGAEPNPRDYNVSAAAAAYRRSGADSIIALGGGSPIDCAKAAGVLIAYDEEDIGLFEGNRGAGQRWKREAGPVPPLMAVPTTSGTGSEVTFSAVITSTAERRKMTIKNPCTSAKIALCDPLLTISVPPALTAATGMDALTHAIEAFTALCAEPVADAAALYAVELIAGSLPAAFKDGGNAEARGKMLMGSVLAGIAFSHADVGSVHCIAEALGGRYDLPHGLCNAVILPYVMEYNMDYCREGYSRIGRAMGLEGGAGAAAEVRRLIAEFKLPSFPELGVKPEDYPAIAAAAERNGSNSSNPRPMDSRDYLAILERMGAAR